MPRLTYRLKDPQALRNGVRGMIANVMLGIGRVFTDEAESSAANIRADGFATKGGATDLQVRSSDAYNSINAQTTVTATSVRARVGAVGADPRVRYYLGVQLEGRTFGARYAGKLAYPPGDAGPPIRDGRGVQLFSLAGGGGFPSFMEAKQQYGYAWLIITENAVYGRVQGSRLTDLLFIRSEQVTVGPRPIVQRERAPMVERTLKRLETEVGLKA